jgi:hypothetical protein
MPASVRQLPENHKLDYDHEHIVECSRCEQKYLLTWDDREWNYVKDWIHIAALAVRKSHPQHAQVELPVSLKQRSFIKVPRQSDSLTHTQDKTSHSRLGSSFLNDVGRSRCPVFLARTKEITLDCVLFQLPGPPTCPDPPT